MSAYDEDFFLWAKRQAGLLQDRRFDELDLPNLVDEVESISRDLSRELHDRMSDVVRLRMLLHALPGEAWASVWKLRIREQRRMNGLILRDAPSLKEQFPTMLADALETGRLRAVEELAYTFRNRCFDDMLDAMPPLVIEDLIG